MSLEAQISGSPMADGKEDAAVKDNLDITTLRNGTNNEVSTSNGGDFHKKLNAVKDHVKRVHLFNLVAKGFSGSRELIPRMYINLIFT